MLAHTPSTLRRAVDWSLTLCMVVLAAGAIHGRAADDTVEGFMATAKAIAAQPADLARTAAEARAFASRVSSDRTFASRLLTAVTKNDTAGVGALLREAMPNGTAVVGRTDADFTFFAHDIKIPLTDYVCSVCISTVNECAPDKTSCSKPAK